MDDEWGFGEAAWALAEMGPAARSAVPHLIDILHDDGARTGSRVGAAKVLWRIADPGRRRSRYGYSHGGRARLCPHRPVGCRRRPRTRRRPGRLALVDAALRRPFFGPVGKNCACGRAEFNRVPARRGLQCPPECRVDKSFNAFFRRLGQGDKPGFPRFKGRDRFHSLEYRHGDGCKLREQDGRPRFYVQNVGEIKIKMHRPLPEGAKLGHVILKRRVGRWYVCFAVELPNTPNPSRTMARRSVLTWALKVCWPCRMARSTTTRAGCVRDHTRAEPSSCMARRYGPASRRVEDVVGLRLIPCAARGGGDRGKPGPWRG
jgi:hypothetical protein